MRSLRRPAVVSLVVLPLALAACGGGSGGSTGTASSTSASSSAPSSGGTATGTSAPAGTTAGTTAAADWGHLAGCPSVGRAVPAGTRTRQTVDVDGDGRPDTAFIGLAPDSTGGVPFGVRTASGAVLASTIRSASPVARSVLFADVTGHGEVIALASDNRQVQLWAVSDCQLIPAQNVQGQQYTFDLGFTGWDRRGLRGRATATARPTSSASSTSPSRRVPARSSGRSCG